MTNPASGKMKLQVCVSEDEEFRTLVRDLITGGVKSILKEELLEITANVIKDVAKPSQQTIHNAVERYASKAYKEAVAIAADRLVEEYKVKLQEFFESQKEELNKKMYKYATKYINDELLDMALGEISNRVLQIPISVNLNGENQEINIKS